MKIPKYVQELVELGRLRPAPLDEQAKEAEKNENAVYGYIFRLYRLSNTQYLSTFMDEACRLMGWHIASVPLLRFCFLCRLMVGSI